MKLYEIHDAPANHPETILHRLVQMVADGQEQKPDHYGMVAACLVDPQLNKVFGLNYMNPDGHRTHAERAAVEAYEKKHGKVPKGTTCITTLSPCSEHMHDREGKSCTDLLNEKGIRKVHAGFIDPTQKEGSDEKRKFDVRETNEATIHDMCKTLASSFLDL